MLNNVDSMQMATNDIQATTSGIAEGIAALNVDLTDTVEQIIDTDRVEWYKERFAMFVKDGCIGAINEYLRMLSSEDANDITRAVILHEALEAQLSVQ